MKTALSSLLCSLLAVTAVLAMSGPPPLTVKALSERVQAELNSLDEEVAQAALALSTVDLKGREAGQILGRIYNDHPAVIDAVTVDLNGKLLLIRPERYQSSAGKSIADQPHFVSLKKNDRPVFSKLFKAVEGFHAVALAYPIQGGETRTKGYLSVVLQPDALVRQIVRSAGGAPGTPEVLAIQTDGQIIYDRDILQVGKLTFSDPAYKNYPALLALARTAVKQAEGQGQYSYPAGPGRAPVTKAAEWASVGLHGTQWRLIVSRPID